MSEPRYALYFTPPHCSPLERLGASFLGYDCYTGEAVAPLPVAGIDPKIRAELTAAPRRYGFHATLKPPFRIAATNDGDALAETLRGFAASWPAIHAGQLRPTLIGGFIALVPVAPPVELLLFAAECVAAFDGFRAPTSAADRARRLVNGLSPRQTALLDRWGYPYVFDQFRFHMTLTGGLPVELRQAWLECLSPVAGGHDLVIDGLSLLRQDSPDHAFKVVERFALGAES